MIRNIMMLGGAGVLLGSCGMVDGRRDAGLPAPVARPSGGGAMVQDFPVKIGNPYQVGGVSYVPADTPNYDEVGYASWYGEESGNLTANGEAFNASGVSAAHKTLPLPSYVEVTALDTGRTILVRVNDRGPFANDRVIDLSRGAAEQLGISGNGSSAVRVRRVSPAEPERAALRSGGRAAERLEAPAALLNVLRKKLGDKPRPAAAAAMPRATPHAVPRVAAPTAPVPPRAPAPKPVPAPAPAPASTSGDPFIIEDANALPKAPPRSAQQSGGYVVPVAAFSTKERATALAQRIGASVSPVGSLWRVRFGPYASAADARQGVKRAAAAGFNDAKIVVND